MIVDGMVDFQRVMADVVANRTLKNPQSHITSKINNHVIVNRQSNHSTSTG
jgi:hypothetical protein